MCIHPRCDEPVVYLLEGTPWGKSVELCELHGPRYHKGGGGQLYRHKNEQGFYIEKQLVEEK